jgi:hypothetical protein
MGPFSCYIKSRGLNFYCPLRRCSCRDSTLGHYSTRNSDPCQPVLPRETYLPSIGRFIPSELSGVQLDEVVHARGRPARELEQIVGHAMVATLQRVRNELCAAGEVVYPALVAVWRRVPRPGKRSR